MTEITSKQEKEIEIQVNEVVLRGNLTVPEKSTGIVIFAHGSGSGRFSPRNREVAKALNEKNLATLLFDLLTETEEDVDNVTAQYRFDIPLLAQRLVGVTDWVTENSNLKNLNIGYFGASTGAGAALIAAAERSKIIRAVVSRGGRPDLAGAYLLKVLAPTLFIIGSLDLQVIELNKQAQVQMKTLTELVLVTGATHLFEEPGTLDQVVKLACDWFLKYLLSS
jgi:dienelactone hydrolase